MANVLSKDRQITTTAALAEGSSIRSIERMTGIHRDTIMRLGVRIGQGCARLLDQRMRNLDCNRIKLQHASTDGDTQRANMIRGDVTLRYWDCLLSIHHKRQ